MARQVTLFSFELTCSNHMNVPKAKGAVCQERSRTIIGLKPKLSGSCSLMLARTVHPKPPIVARLMVKKSLLVESYAQTSVRL